MMGEDAQAFTVAQLIGSNPSTLPNSRGAFHKEANYPNSYTECGRMFKNGGFLFLPAGDKPGHSCTSTFERRTQKWIQKSPHICGLSLSEICASGAEQRASLCTVRVWISSSPLPGVFATLHSTAKQSSEDTAAPGMSTELQPRTNPSDSDSLAPRGGQDMLVAAWMWRALPSSYRRLLPAGLGESRCFAKAKSNPTQMEMSKCQMPGGSLAG